MNIAVFNLLAFAAQAPLYIVWLIGIVLALVRWRHHPRASLLMVIALALAVADQIGGILVNLFLPSLVGQLLPIGSMGMFLTAVSGLRSLLSAVVFGLLLAAVFVERAPVGEEEADEKVDEKAEEEA